jgi:SSS family solute:Na+ symporter
MASSRRVPLIASVPKMFFPFLVILPGLIALALTNPVQQNAASPDQTNQSPQALEMKSVQQGLIPPQTNPETGEVVKDQNGKVVLDYNLVIPNMLLHYFPNGMLGLGLTALLASFMSGMAGNVTAFNTVWTYDIFKAYIRRDATDENLLVVGQLATFFGVAISVGVAYFVAAFNNIMDVLQLVFAFVNAPLFATFLLGMFWKRATGHGAFFGLLSGTVGAAVHQGLTISAGSTPGVKGAWIALVHTYPSQMAQNFWTAIYAWTVCFLVTIVISLFTKPRREEDLKGLVYALTEKAHETGGRWYLRPVPVGIAVLTLTLILNLIFR